MSWLLKFEMVCWDLTLSWILFHPIGVDVAKSYLPMAFLGWT